MNIADILDQQAQQLRAASNIYFDDSRWTYQTLNQHVWKVSEQLHRSGIRRGEVIAHTFASELALLVTMLASARIGATVFTVPRNMSPRQRDIMLNAVSATWLATDLPDLNGATLKLIQICVNPKADKIDEQAATPWIKDSDPVAPWIIVAGSGTTGKPKLMAVTHRQQWARMQVGLHWLPYAEHDVLHSLVHLDFYGAKQRYLEAFMKGASISLDANRHLAHNDGHLLSVASVIYGTVFHVEQLLKSLPNNSKGFDDSFTALMIGGSTVSFGLRNRIRERLSANLYVLYGANECHTACRTGLADVFDSLGNVGRAFPGFELQIVDANDVPMPPEQVGQVRIRSTATIDGYLKDAIATSRAFKQGWFYPGDLGKLTADGQLIHLGRADDMMIVNGINVYPAEIEQVMASHPAVQDAVALPLRHPVHQDIPVCAVTLLPNGQANEQALLVYARERLGAHSPHQIIIVGSIPRTAQGKLIRNELAALTMAQLSQPHVPVQKIRTSRQLTWRIFVSFQVPQKFDLVLLDTWLTQILTNDLAGVPVPDFPGQVFVPEFTQQWLWRCLQLARLLLQAARVPVFDPPQVLSCERDTQASPLWKAGIALALIDDQLCNLYLESLNTAFRLATWAALQPMSEGNLNHFFETISQRILIPAAQILPFGKSSFPVLKVAHAMTIPFRHLGGGVYQLGWGANAKRLDRSATELDSTIGARLSHSKALTARLLRNAGLPGPVHEVVKTPEMANKAARHLGWPVVVKPADGERGEGVTVNVADEEALKFAFDVAMGFSRSKTVIVERQVAGVCHRLFMVNGKVLYAVKRWPMSVIGDGRHTVAELVSLEVVRQQQKPPWKRSEIKPLDELAKAAVAAAGFSETSVAPMGALVPLRTIESTEWGGVDEEVTHLIHPENLRIAQSAVALMGLYVSGVDIITTDIGQPWHDNGAIINEVNFAPLLGGADISRRHIPMFLDDLVKDRGHIPVKVFVGGARAWQVAVQEQRSLVSKGISAYLTHEFQTFSPMGESMRMPFAGIYHRAQALLLSSNVGAMVLCIQTDELLTTGLPLEWVDALTFVDMDWRIFDHPEQALPANRITALQQILRNWV